MQKRNIRTYRGGLPQHKLIGVTDYINDRLDRELSLYELAAIAQLSPYHFSRAFKQSTGISPHHYVIQQRVERTQKLLLQGKMNLAEIAIAQRVRSKYRLRFFSPKSPESPLQTHHRSHSQNSTQQVIARTCKNSNIVQDSSASACQYQTN